MKALNNVHPITHAVGNTMRRVVIMLVCMVVFRTPLTPLGAVGSAMAVGGSYFYAMTKTKEAQRAKQLAQEQEPAAPDVETRDDSSLEERLRRVLPLEVVPAESASPKEWLVWRGPRLEWGNKVEEGA